MECSKGLCLWITLFLLLLGILVIPFQYEKFRVHVPHGLAEELFKNFTAKYNKSYDRPEEFQKRLNIFTQALEDIVHSNMEKDTSAHYGVTRYSDLTEEEFRRNHLNGKISHFVGARLDSIKRKPSNISIPIKIVIQDVFDAENEKYRLFYNNSLMDKNLNYIPLKVDWRQEHVLPAVRKQGKCGACWAYSVIGMIESNLAIQKSINETLSVQQIIDCARNGNIGCNGGDTCSLLEWLVRNKIQIQTDADYPISNEHQNQTCKAQNTLDANSTKKFVRVTDYTCNSFIDDEIKLLEIIANYGPVAAAVNALPWQHYVSGIIQNDCSGDVKQLNHAVQIVGFDRSGSVPHYIIQNSWGSDFGENGYMRIAFGKNICGIASQVSLAKLSS